MIYGAAQERNVQPRGRRGLLPTAGGGMRAPQELEVDCWLLGIPVLKASMATSAPSPALLSLLSSLSLFLTTLSLCFFLFTMCLYIFSLSSCAV